jgi:hypothetical protein
MASILRILCPVAILIALCVTMMYSSYHKIPSLSLSIDIDHAIILKLEYLRHLADTTLNNTDDVPCGMMEIADAFQLFRQIGNISGDFSDFVYSLSDVATSQDVLFGRARVYADNVAFDKYAHPLAKNKEISMDKDLVLLSINISFVINHYTQGIPRLTEKEFFANEFYSHWLEVRHCFFGDSKSLVTNNAFLFDEGSDNENFKRNYYIGVIFNQPLRDDDSFYIKVFASMKEGVYFKDLNENPYDGGPVLITSIPLK